MRFSAAFIAVSAFALFSASAAPLAVRCTDPPAAPPAVAAAAPPAAGGVDPALVPQFNVSPGVNPTGTGTSVALSFNYSVV